MTAEEVKAMCVGETVFMHKDGCESVLCTVAYHGRRLAPIYAAGTMILIDTDYIAPIKDDQPDYFVRPSRSGQLHLVAKSGMLIEAIIAPVGIDAELYGRLKTMLAGMETAAGMDEEECGVWSVECGVKVSPEATD